MATASRSPKKSRWLLYGLYALTFLFACCVMANSPLATDDYLFLAKGATTLRQALNESLHYGNGRLLGNLSTLLLLRHPIALVLEKAFITLGVAALAARLVARDDCEKEPFYFALTAVLLFGMNGRIFAEILSWTSCFQNYVPPVFALLVCAAAFRHEPKSTAGKAADLALIVLFGVTGQLYMELSSLINVLIAAAVVVFCALKQRERLAKGVVWLVSLVLGGAVMVAVPRLFPPATDSVSQYRELHVHGLGDLIGNAAENAAQTITGLFACHLLIVLVAAAALLLVNRCAASFRRPLGPALCRVGLIFSAASSVFFGFLGAKTLLTRFYSLYLLAAAAAFAVLAVCVVAVLLHLPKSTEKALMLGSIAAAAAAIAPMMLVKPFGYRCLFLSYCFLGAFVLLTAKAVLREASPAVCRKTTAAGLCAFAALVVCLSVLFTDIGWMSRQQVAYIQNKLREHPQQIEVITLPTDYVYTPEIWGFGRVYYNEEPLDVSFVYLDFDEWYEHRQAEGWIK